MSTSKRPGGRAPGTKNRRTIEGEDFARDILVQDDEEILVTTEQAEVPTKDGGTQVVSHDVEHDRHERAIADPVYRALRRQARAGVGNLPGQLPPAVFSALADRAFGKVADKLKLQGGRPLAQETDEELLARMRELEAAIKLPEREISTDNAAMIAAAGLRQLAQGHLAPADLNAAASLAL